jgi:hypothetical protein
MADIWINGRNGDWGNKSNWSNGVPSSGSDVQITAPGGYTVSVSDAVSIDTLTMADSAQLSIQKHHINITQNGVLAGTIAIAKNTALGFGSDQGVSDFQNTGSIDIADGGKVQIAGETTLSGNGYFALNGPTALLETNGVVAQLNNSNTIVGSGIIGKPFGDESSLLTFINNADGVVFANDPNGLLINVVAGAANNGRMLATTSGLLILMGQFNQAENGLIAAQNAGATIQLSDAQINSGYISTVANATLSCRGALGRGSMIITSQPIDNAGTIATIDGDLTIYGSINNSGSLSVGANMNVEGPVTGGQANITGGGYLRLGAPSSVNVTFGPISSGFLVLNAAEKFTGTISGMDTNGDAAIHLPHIPYSSHVTVSVTSPNVLTVTDSAIPRTINLNVIGTRFVAQRWTDGSTAIICKG